MGMRAPTTIGLIHPFVVVGVHFLSESRFVTDRLLPGKEAAVGSTVPMPRPFCLRVCRGGPDARQQEYSQAWQLSRSDKFGIAVVAALVERLSGCSFEVAEASLFHPPQCTCK